MSGQSVMSACLQAQKYALLGADVLRQWRVSLQKRVDKYDLQQLRASESPEASRHAQGRPNRPLAPDSFFAMDGSLAACSPLLRQQSKSSRASCLQRRGAMLAGVSDAAEARAGSKAVSWASALCSPSESGGSGSSTRRASTPRAPAEACDALDCLAFEVSARGAWRERPGGSGRGGSGL